MVTNTHPSVQAAESTPTTQGLVSVFYMYTILYRLTSRSGQTSSASERLGNPKVKGSNLELAVLNPGQMKTMTLKLILVTPWPVAWYY